MIRHNVGLGTRLRCLLSLLDGDVQTTYDALAQPFRSRFYPVTILLRESGPLSVNEIARLTGVTQPAVTQTVREMCKRGLLETSSGADRRARQVGLTEAGRRLAEELGSVWAAIARAAEALESELASPLGPLLDQAIAALRHEPFAARIQRQLSIGADQ
jgi:MarR family transcriptional regulator, organic hydroperoxide resistance regulator